MPSALGECSAMITWPLFSPPSPASETSIGLEDVLVADRRSHDAAAGALDGQLPGRRSTGR